ncbi:MAG TPA: hypothetical protein VLR47_01675 [Rhodospirillales bacterium]|nr:hypothetical protein [Rhodospirillales bacterium]
MPKAKKYFGEYLKRHADAKHLRSEADSRSAGEAAAARAASG